MKKVSLALVAQFATLLGLGVAASIINVAWPFIRDNFGRTDGDLGVLLLALMFGYMGAAFLVGRLVDRYGVGLVLIAGGLIIIAGLLGWGYSPIWAALLLSVFLTGMGSGLLDTTANIYAARHFSARLTNWLHASYGLGAVVGPLLTTAVISWGRGWRLAYLMGALLQVVIWLLYLAVRQDVSMRGMTVEERPENSIPLRSVLKSPLVWLGMFYFFMYGGLEHGAGQWSFPLFTEGRGVALEPAGTWVSIYWGSLTVGRVVLGQVTAWLGSQRLLRLSHLLALLGAILLSIPSMPVLGFAGLALIGFAVAPIFPTLIQLTPQRVGRKAAATAVGFQVGVTSLGIALLPGLAGILIDRISLEVVGPFLIVVALICLAVNERMSAQSAVELK
ncbi:MAG: MFS transporter [Anaerolineales bacterium]|nr:MFS transporter [Anaerolineales bacterium]